MCLLFCRFKILYWDVVVILMIFDEWDFYNYVEIFDNYIKNRFMIDSIKIE